MAQNAVIDQSSGFIENVGQLYVFDAVKKQQFLDVFRKTHRCKNSANSLGISFHTIQKHYTNDPKFKEAFDQVEQDIAEELQDTSIAVGLTDKGFMDRCMQLRRLRPASYAPTKDGSPTVINVSIDGKMIEASMKRDKIIDALIVEDQQKRVLALNNLSNVKENNGVI